MVAAVRVGAFSELPLADAGLRVGDVSLHSVSSPPTPSTRPPVK